MYGKKIFLQKLTEQKGLFRSVQLTSTNFEGSTPPSVFIGHENYPRVFAGPMMAQNSDSGIYDSPEQWLHNYKKEQIIDFRLNLVRGKRVVGITDVASKFVQQMQDITLSRSALYTHAEFDKIPRGVTVSEEHQPFGPSALLRNIEIEESKWQKDMEKAFYDYDLRASDAVFNLHEKGIPFTQVQKALSTGAFGRLKSRKLVPTRWSITAADDILAKQALAGVKQNEIIPEYRVYESGVSESSVNGGSKSGDLNNNSNSDLYNNNNNNPYNNNDNNSPNNLHNYFAVLMTPTQWQYEAVEAFINVLGRKTFTFSDYERHFGRKTYADMGGCYYAQKNAVAEHLKQRNEQAGAFVFREVYEGYTPTGVWVCRELTKDALKREPKTFGNMKEALQYINQKTQLGVNRLRSEMPLLNEFGKQRTLKEF